MEQLHDQDEYVVQATNVSQPIKYAVGLSSCRFNDVPRYKFSIDKSVSAPRIFNQILSLTIFKILWTNAKEVFLFLLSKLEPGCLILDQARSDLKIFLLSLVFSNLIYLGKEFRLFDNSVFSELLQVKTFLVVQNMKIEHFPRVVYLRFKVCVAARRNSMFTKSSNIVAWHKYDLQALPDNIKKSISID